MILVLVLFVRLWVATGAELNWLKGLAASLAMASAAAQAGQAAAACTEVFRFEPNARLGIADIAGLGPFSGPRETLANRLLVVREFRPLARPTRGEWTGLAMVYGTTDATPVGTVGGVLWTRRPEGFSEGHVASYAMTPEALEARFVGAGASSICPGGFVVRLDKTGRFIAGGSPVGVVFPDPVR